MVLVLVLFAVGAVLGYLLRRQYFLKSPVDRLTQLALVAMLFLLGVNVGKNEEIMQNLSSIGWQALVLTVGAMAGSVLSAWLVYELFFKKK